MFLVNDRTFTRRLIKYMTVLIALVFFTQTHVLAAEREQAKRLHDRISGVPASAQILDDMTTDISTGNAIDAAYTAMDNSNFYNVTLKNYSAPWTNRDQSVFVPFNDYIATVIGMVRDDVPFNTLLSADILYVADQSAGLPAYSMSNNDHYEAIENQNLDLQTVLVQTTQSAVMDIPAGATAGIMTTRAASEAFFIDGTNRAMFRFTLLNHLCNDMEQVKDVTRVPDRIRQDVSRSPGGDSRIFLNNCIGCHSGMDPMAQAFAYYDFDETVNRMVYTEAVVQSKYHINETNFKPGFETPDDAWTNYWRSGQNTVLGWDENLPGSGSGAKTMGEELAASDAFAQCQVKKVFRTMCFRDPSDTQDRDQITSMVSSFKNSNYSLKQVFAESAVYCMGN